VTLIKDHLIIVDLEATCWKKNPPPGQQSEIIEIGICTLDLKSLEIHDKRSYLIKPIRSVVSEFCTKLTSLTPEQVGEGTTFAEACDAVREAYNAPNRLWSSWGGYDLRMFKWQCDSFGVAYPFSNYHVDLKGLYAAVRRKGKRCGMARACKELGIDMTGHHHRGDDDAYNTAQIMIRLLREDGHDILSEFYP
jgi:inhibitor of KinA sporulation pathway (predicted exonuclease)